MHRLEAERSPLLSRYIELSHLSGTTQLRGRSKGDTPEPTYILKLDEPICATVGEFVDPNTKFDRIQIFPESDKAAQALWRDLRGFIGQRVLVAGTGAFGRQTGHHHAPLMLPIVSISAPFDPTKSHGT